MKLFSFAFAAVLSRMIKPALVPELVPVSEVTCPMISKLPLTGQVSVLPASAVPVKPAPAPLTVKTSVVPE